MSTQVSLASLWAPSTHPSQPSQSSSSPSLEDSVLRRLFRAEGSAADSALTTPTSGNSRVQSNIADFGDTPAPSGYYGSFDWGRIRGPYGPAPDGEGLMRSWIKEHGWRIISLVDNSSYWVCHRCYCDNRPFKPLRIESGTAGPTDHLVSVHKRNRKGPIESSKRKIDKAFPSSSSEPTYTHAIDRYYNNFDPSVFKGKILKWIVRDNGAFRRLEDPDLKDILFYLKPELDHRGYLPSHQTVQRSIEIGFQNALPSVQRLLDSSISKIHLSFDIWTSRKMKTFCGIHAHFCTSKGYTTLLLALPRQAGHHTGVKVAETIIKTMSTFGITSDRVGWSVSDNASNNDTCLEAVAEQLDLNANERRLRCAGHVLNLIGQNILFGTDKSTLEPEDVEITKEADTLALELAKWRKRGPVGKLHNLIVWIRRSTLQRERFEAKQLELGLEKHELIQDNSTRWNSVFYSMKRAVEQKQAIESILEEELAEWNTYVLEITQQGRVPLSDTDARAQPAILDDKLTQDDWFVITEYLRILAPLEEATKRLQGRGQGGSHGCVWQVIPVMEALLRHFEQLRLRYKIAPPGEQSQVSLNEVQNTPVSEQNTSKSALALGKRQPRSRKSQSQAAANQSQPVSSHLLPEPVDSIESDPRRDHLLLCTNLNLGWSKLNKYYSLTDLSAAYVASVVLHPRYTWRYIKKYWSHKKLWIRQAEQRVLRLWAEYSTFVVEQQPEPVPSRNSGSRLDHSLFDLTDDEDDEPPQEEDEYSLWVKQSQDKNIYRPLEFWMTEKARRQFPKLSRLALDVFTIPAMSDDPERTFSSCSLMINPHKGKLGSDSIAYAQCLKNWLDNEIVSTDVFIQDA